MPTTKDDKDKADRDKAEAEEAKARSAAGSAEEPKAKKMTQAEALDFLEDDANQLRVSGHPSLEREMALLTLRGGKGESRLMPVEGQPWPVTLPAAEQAEAEYARQTATGNHLGEPVIEGDPFRDRKAIERKHEIGVQRDPEAETERARKAAS